VRLPPWLCWLIVTPADFSRRCSPPELSARSYTGERLRSATRAAFAKIVFVHVSIAQLCCVTLFVFIRGHGVHSRELPGQLKHAAPLFDSPNTSASGARYDGRRRLPALVTRRQLRGFMNIREGVDSTGGATAAAVPPTPAVDPDNDERFLREGGEAACAREWNGGGYVALANFNQV
jgi:hypothetical protein